MPEPLKNQFNPPLIQSLCEAITATYSAFDSQAFSHQVLDEDWQGRELKARMRHISHCLNDFLPDDYPHSLDILIQASASFSGMTHMFFADFVEVYGLDHFDASMKALMVFTQGSTAEFAVRPFIKRYPEKMMAQMLDWATADNHHLRRLASEGCRPRLPWAMALPAFKNDPQPVLVILETLKCDDSEYVRRSVANNLNDIAKDNPELLIELAISWHGKNRDTDWIVKHGCRTLLKKAQPEILTLFGFFDPKHVIIEGFTLPTEVAFEASLEYSFTIKSRQDKLGHLRVEYAIDFMKSNGKQSRKLFKIGEADYDQALKIINKTHSFKNLSTRKHYPGLHSLAIIVNGQQLVSGDFVLTSA
jgi:3-methyladenine DNA glycosylase AlkC